MDITFLLNGEVVSLSNVSPTTTLLDWLREERGLTGTKEGCNEGDCGACSVMITDENGSRALNGCILFLPQVNGKAVTTVEGMASADGTLHPVQETMVEHHGSQCGFCTPGFVVSMATAHLNGATDHDVQLAGNLCRCTGYAPIIRAAEAAAGAPVPAHLRSLKDNLAQDIPAPAKADGAPHVQPENSDALAAWYPDNPDATLIAGATDVGLWVTKGFRELGAVAFLNRCADLRGITEDETGLRIGAMTTLTEVEAKLSPLFPSLGVMLRRYGSTQVRNAATLGGNIANGSPIGDGPPAARRRAARDAAGGFLPRLRQTRPRGGRICRGDHRAAPARYAALLQTVETFRSRYLGSLRLYVDHRQWHRNPHRAHRLWRHGGNTETRRCG